MNTPLPGTFSNPMEELLKGYDRMFQRCADLNELSNNKTFEQLMESVWRRFYTLCWYARSDLLSPEKREMNRCAANELERFLNTICTAIVKYRKMLDPEHQYQRFVDHKKEELEMALREERRP